MPILEINGRRVQVGDDFLALSPDEQNDTVEEIAGSLGLAGGSGGQSATGDRPAALEAASAGARGFNKYLTDLAGAPGNLMDLAAVPIAKGLGLVGEDRDHVFGGADQTARRALDGAAHAVGMSDDQRMAYEHRNELPRDYRWAGAAGEMLGGAAPFAAGLGLAAKGASLAGRAATSGSAARAAGQEMAASVARNPTAWAVGEATAAAGGAQGAAFAQNLNPNNPTYGDIGGLVGSIANPAGLVMATGGAARRAANGLGTALGSKKAAEGYAADYLSRLMAAGGEASAEHLDVIRKALDAGKADELISSLSTADRSLSPTLLGLQSRMAADSPDFAKALEAQRAGASAGLRDAATAELGGDVSALSRQAETVRDRADAQRRTFVGNAQEQNVVEREALSADAAAFRGRAEEAAGDASGRFPVDSEARSLANVEARETLDTAYQADRGRESQLWGRLDLSQRVGTEGFKRALKNIESRMLPGEELPQPIREVAKLAGNKRVKFSGLGVQNTRSRLLTLQRDAASGAAPDRNAASIYGQLADGLLDDLSVIAGSGEARTFSRELNDRWSRTFAGQTQQRTATGADKVGEGMTLERAMQGAPQQRATNFADLRTAAGESAGAMTTQQEAYLRNRIGSLRDPQTGALSPAKAAAFAQENEGLLSAFPALRADLEQAVSTGQALRNDVPAFERAAADRGKASDAALSQRVSNAEQTRKQLDANSPFGRVLKAGERPERAVAGALTGNNPLREFKGLASLAKGGGEDAVAGLRQATLDHVFAEAGKGGPQVGEFWGRVGDRLAAPVSSGKPALADVLTGSRVLNRTQKARLDQIVQYGRQIEQADALGREVKSSGPMVGTFMDQIIRTAGANYGAGFSLFGHAGGASLSAASYGSRVFRKLFEQAPQQKAAAVLQRALNDDALMKKLLLKVKPENEPTLAQALKQHLTDWQEGRASVREAVSGAAKTAGGAARERGGALQLSIRPQYRPKAATIGAAAGLLSQ